jgi:hypothetical protein
MSYYIRVLGTQDPDIHIDTIVEALDKEGFDARFGLHNDETPEKWSFFELKNEKAKVLAIVERSPVKEGEIGKEELDEFRETILQFQPLSAAKWLNAFFDRVKVIYAFELKPAGMDGDNYHIITTTQSAIWEQVKGILQADDEGFSNEEGYHILWQFTGEAEGTWNCAVLNHEGQWENFAMDLGDKKQEKAFKEGVIPTGARRIS